MADAANQQQVDAGYEHQRSRDDAATADRTAIPTVQPPRAGARLLRDADRQGDPAELPPGTGGRGAGRREPEVPAKWRRGRLPSGPLAPSG